MSFLRFVKTENKPRDFTINPLAVWWWWKKWRKGSKKRNKAWKSRGVFSGLKKRKRQE